MLASISDSTWWIQGKQGCNYILCAADYGKFTRKAISKHLLRDTRFICNSPRKPGFADALHIFLSQFSELETRIPNPWKEGSVNILQSAAKYQQSIILAASSTSSSSEDATPITDFSRDDALVALSLNCLCRTVGLGCVVTRFPELRDFEREGGGSHKTIQAARHGRGKEEDALLPLIELSEDTTDYWTPPTRSCSRDRGWDLDSSIGSALHHITRRTRQLLYQGNPRDWPTVLYVLCILELFVGPIYRHPVWMRTLTDATRQLRLLIEDLSGLYYRSTGGGQPFSYDWDREMYTRQVGGDQLAVEHFAELNGLWKAWCKFILVWFGLTMKNRDCLFKTKKQLLVKI